MSEDIKDMNVETEQASEQANEQPVEKTVEQANVQTMETEAADTVQETEKTAAEAMDGTQTADENAVTPTEEATEEAAKSTDGKVKKEKKPLTPEQKKKRMIKALIITGAVLVAIAIIISSIAIANAVVVKALLKAARSFEKVKYDQRPQYVIVEDGATAVEGNMYKDTDDDYWTFVTDGEFKVLQLTDVHIGGGSFSKSNDLWAMNAVATMIRQEQPDLVIVTGDIAFPVPYATGSFDNIAPTQIFVEMMESLEVYWTFAFGNHDTEAYSTNTREQICKWYESQELKYCLFDRGFSSEDNGYGNNIIKVRKTNGVITQALVTLDSHSYIEGDYFGMAWKYDNIHEDQIKWYEQEMKKLVAVNNALLEENPAIGVQRDEYIKNLAFFHIPLKEYREAWSKVIESNGGKKATNDEKVNGKYDSLENPEGVEYLYGLMGESDKTKNGQRTYGVFCGLHEDEFFETGIYNGLQGVFCGHDHYNNFSVNYTKEVDGQLETVRLTYGMSIDYLAYPGIYKEHSQRGCTVITVNSDGSFDCEARNYYRDYKGVTHERD